jgi:hypothetical protein
MRVVIYRDSVGFLVQTSNVKRQTSNVKRQTQLWKQEGYGWSNAHVELYKQDDCMT